MAGSNRPAALRMWRPPASAPTSRFGRGHRRINPLNFFINSPNFVWFLVALADYLICPYDLEKAKTWTADWVIYRCAVNTFIMLTYFGFWSLTLYSLGYGKRKFNQEHVASPSRMFHNVWYCVLGAIQLGLWEALFMHCYATGKLDYIKNEEAFATPENAFRMVFFTLAIPLYRSVHFYFAHRFIHIRALCECSALLCSAPRNRAVPSRHRCGCCHVSSVRELRCPGRRQVRALAAPPQHGHRALRRPVHAPNRASVLLQLRRAVAGLQNVSLPHDVAPHPPAHLTGT